MKSFKQFLENKDKEELKRIFGTSKGFTIGKSPQYDYDDNSEEEDSHYIGYNPSVDSDIDSNLDHATPDDFADMGASFHFDQAAKENLEKTRPRVELYFLNKIEKVAQRVKDWSVYHHLIEKNITRTDWLIAADWLEDHDEPAENLRRFARKVYK